jgi:hypothetical protein
MPRLRRYSRARATAAPSRLRSRPRSRRPVDVTAAFAADKLRILTGEDALTTYQFNTRVAKHFFCRHCGIYPFHQTRRDPKMWRANIGCLDGIDLFALEASVADGASLSVVVEEE